MYFYDLKNRSFNTKSTEKERLKVDFVSDLHLDFYINSYISVKEFVYKYILQNKKGEIIVVGGDISHKNELSKEFLEILVNNYEYVLVIPGNHDWYLQKKSEDRYASLIESIKDPKVVFLMDGVEIFEYKGVKFAGTMMMYNLNEDVSYYTWRSLLNDSKFISREFANKRNKADVDYYNKVISQVDVFISHIPILNLDGLEATKNLFLNVDVEEKENVLYVSGHTHKKKSSTEQNVKSTGLNVSFGYPAESEDNSAVTTIAFI